MVQPLEDREILSLLSLFTADNVLLATSISLLLPAALAGAFYCGQRMIKDQPCPHIEVEDFSIRGRSCQELEVCDWQEAGHLEGCPWCFDGCQDLEAALLRIWRRPLASQLHGAYSLLASQVRGLQVALIPAEAGEGPRFAALYALEGGAQLFGGAPLEHAVGVELSWDDEGSEPGTPSRSPSRSPSCSPSRRGLRRRRGLASPKSAAPQPTEFSLPCLSGFYRVHDGFGVLLSKRHLVPLFRDPSDCLEGSCFYVYPSRGLEWVSPRSPLLRFARVDSRCQACADCTVDEPCVVYVEHGGEHFEDEDSPLAFVADTICNVAGRG